MAIEAKDFTEKDKLVAQFYTLRAGLSVIAEETKKIHDLENSKEALEQKDIKHRREIEEKISHEKSLFSYEKRSITRKYTDKIDPNRRKISELNMSISRLENSLNILDSPKGRHEILQKTSIGKRGYLVCLLGLCCCAWILPLLLTITSEPLARFFMLIVSIGISVTLSTITYLFIKRNLASKKIQEEQQFYKHNIEAFQLEIFLIEKDIKNLEHELEREIQAIDVQLQEIELQTLDKTNEHFYLDFYKEPIRRLNAQFKQELLPHTTRVKSVTKALHKQFDHLLLETDWENVDLLIFYLTTGRADSLKEALLLVDQQRQTNQIVGAIHSASQHIAFTMQDTTRRLAGVMTGCFSELSKQIRVGHDAIIAQTSRTADTIEHLTGSVESMNTKLEDFSSSISAQGKTLLETKELNQALLNQANQSSQQLMAELRYNQRYWYK